MRGSTARCFPRFLCIGISFEAPEEEICNFRDGFPLFASFGRKNNLSLTENGLS